MTVAELGTALACARPYRRSIVVDHRGSGTCALVAFGSPLDPAFGPDSARAHIGSGAVALSGDWPGLRCDVDTGADLAAALDLGVGARTRAALTRITWPHTCAH